MQATVLGAHLAAAAALILLSTEVVMAKEVEEKLERELPLKPGGKIELSHVTGRLRLSPSGGDKLIVRGTKRVEADSAEEAARELKSVSVEFDASPSKISISTRYGTESMWEKLKKLFTGQAMARVSVDLDLQVPPGAQVELKTVSGDLEAHGLKGEFEARTVSGPMRLSDLQGELSLESVSGAIQATGLVGAVEFRTVSGAVTADRVGGGELEAKSVSGDLLFHVVAGGWQGARLETVSGDMVLSLPAGSSAGVEFRSVSGKATVPAQAVAGTKGRSWKLGGGEPSLRVKSVSGDFGLKVE